MALSPNLRAALFMCISMAAFTVNDAVSKWVSHEMNMGQVMVVRGFFASLLITAIAWHQRAFARPRLLFHPKVLMRSLCEAGATLAFLISLAQLPIGNVAAVLQALPLAVTMGAALFFSEPVGWRRWLAILVGFIGVMIIVKPGTEGFNSYSLLTLISVGFCAARDLITRLLPSDIPTLLVSTSTAVLVAFLGIFTVAPLGGWTSMSVGTTGLVAFGAVMLLVGYQFIIKSMRVGDISFVAPFRYTALLWAMVLGFLVFGDIPDTWMLVGAAIVVGSGLYTLYREQLVGRHKIVAESTQPGMAPDGL